MAQLSLSFINQELGGDKDVIVEMLIALKEMIGTYRSIIESALENKNYETIYNETHKLMNACAIFELKKISILMKEIEVLAERRVGIKEIKLLYAQTEKLMSDLDNEIEERIY